MLFEFLNFSTSIFMNSNNTKIISIFFLEFESMSDIELINVFRQLGINVGPMEAPSIKKLYIKKHFILLQKFFEKNL